MLSSLAIMNESSKTPPIPSSNPSLFGFQGATVFTLITRTFGAGKGHSELVFSREHNMAERKRSRIVTFFAHWWFKKYLSGTQSSTTPSGKCYVLWTMLVWHLEPCCALDRHDDTTRSCVKKRQGSTKVTPFSSWLPPWFILIMANPNRGSLRI